MQPWRISSALNDNTTNATCVRHLFLNFEQHPLKDSGNKNAALSCHVSYSAKWEVRSGRQRRATSLTSALVEGEWSASRPDRFNPRERASVTHWIGGWLGPRTGLADVEIRKTCSYRNSNSDPSTAQPIARRDIDCSMTALRHCFKTN
jgi:hypothetical protein